MNKTDLFESEKSRYAFEILNSTYGEELCRGTIKVEWVDLGEGWSGDYNPDDPEDESLLRFDVSEWDNELGWIEISDASYCTQMPVDTPKEILQRALELIMENVFTSANFIILLR